MIKKKKHIFLFVACTDDMPTKACIYLEHYFNQLLFAGCFMWVFTYLYNVQSVIIFEISLLRALIDVCLV